MSLPGNRLLAAVHCCSPALHCGHEPVTCYPCADSTGLLPPVLAHPSGRVTRVYKLGTWCTPCGYADNNCHEQFMLQRVVGSVNLTEMVSWQLFNEHGVSGGSNRQCRRRPLSLESRRRAGKSRLTGHWHTQLASPACTSRQPPGCIPPLHSHLAGVPGRRAATG